MFKAWIAAPLALLLTTAAAPPAPGSSSVEIKGDRALIVEDQKREALSLTFADEFDGFSRFDGRRGLWRTAYWFHGEGAYEGRTMAWHQEQQLYVHAGDKGTGDAPLGIDPFPVRDGMLEITAARTTPAQAKALWDYQYTSGLITTKDAFSQAYGYFEMRAKLPAGKGLWPAFWLAPEDKSWPPEIDIVEMLGHEPTRVFVTTHVREGEQVHRNYVTVDTSKDFHTYGMAWSPRTIRYYFDRREMVRIATPKAVNKPLYVLANLAVGGQWPGPVDETTPFPSKMIIDYIRVYQFDDRLKGRPKVVGPQSFATPATP